MGRSSASKRPWMAGPVSALSALAVIAGASGCGSPDRAPSPAAPSATATRPSAAPTGVRFSDFRSVSCNLLGPGETEDTRLVFEVHLQVNRAITVTVHTLTIQWHRNYVSGPVIATETVPIGPGNPPVTDRLLWAFAWASTSGLTFSQNSPSGPNPVACTVEAISGTAATERSRSLSTPIAISNGMIANITPTDPYFG